MESAGLRQWSAQQRPAPGWRSSPEGDEAAGWRHRQEGGDCYFGGRWVGSCAEKAILVGSRRRAGWTGPKEASPWQMHCAGRNARRMRALCCECSVLCAHGIRRYILLIEYKYDT